MPAYVIVDIEITDPTHYEEYKRLAGRTVTAYDGKYLVRGGAAERLEGDREPHRIVVLEFPTAARAKEWWSSDAYAPAKEMRHRAAHSEMVLVDGV